MNTATSQFDGHTPGEWKIKAINSRTNRVVGDETSSGWDKLHITGGNRTIAVVYRQADARLIAAAPELLRQRDALLAALRGIMPEAVGWGNSLSHDDYADAARKAAKVLESIENGA